MNRQQASEALLAECLTCTRLPKNLRERITTHLGTVRSRGQPRKAEPDRVSELRQQGLTQQQIADVIGCHVNAVGRVLRASASE